MEYKYTYKDWEEGIINYDSIIANSDTDYYISNDSISKIRKKQRQIFSSESRKRVKILFTRYISKYRDEEDKNEVVNSLLETIHNLFYMDINSFEDVNTLDLSEAQKNQIPEEKYVKKIPPFNFLAFDKNTLLLIKEVKERYDNERDWDFQVVKTPIIEDLNKHVDYIAEVNTKAYYEFSKQIEAEKGAIYNTFISEKLEENSLGIFRADLIKYGFIDRDIERYRFIKIFQGYYLLEGEEINWLKSQNSLNYTISEIIKLGLISIPKNYGKWEIVRNCFRIKGKKITQTNLRVAHKNKITINDKKKLSELINNL